MPEITQDTPTTSITIAGSIFVVAQPYKAGDVLNTNEAAALNQTFAENVRNNFASRVKAAGEGADLELLQSELDSYVDDYEFGVRTGGGRSADPVMAEALAITRDLVRQALSRAGKKLADYSAATITELARKQLANTEDANTIAIFSTARARVEAQSGLTLQINADSVDQDESEAPGDETEEADEAKTVAAE